jgi:hypothetical protein
LWIPVKKNCHHSLNSPFVLVRFDHVASAIIADRLKETGWSLGWVSAVHSEGRTIWIADAHRGDGKRFIVRSDEKVTAFVELEAAIRGCSELA